MGRLADAIVPHLHLFEPRRPLLADRMVGPNSPSSAIPLAFLVLLLVGLAPLDLASFSFLLRRCILRLDIRSFLFNVTRSFWRCWLRDGGER